MTAPAASIDLSQFEKKIAGLRQVGQQTLTDSLVAGGAVVERAAKKNVRSQNLIDTGNLRASIRMWVVSPTRVDIGTDLIYAAVHEFGHVIRPKSAKYLRFKTKSGNWVTVDKVTIPARPYLRPALNENLTEIIARVTEVIQGALNNVP